MTLDQLLALHAIVTEGTFRGAAQSLHKSQSAISHMLKKLEEEVELTLLSREAYRPSLTPAGEVFYRQTTKVLQHMQDLNSTAKNLSQHQEATLQLAVSATYPITGLLTIIKQASNIYPTTHIRLSSEAMGGAAERLLRDNADIVIATMDGINTEQVEAVPFTNITIIPVAHPHFTPAASAHIKTINDMQSYTQIIVAGSSSKDYAQSRDLLPGGLRWTVSDFATKKEILLAGMGWGGMPEHLISTELAQGRLVPIQVEGYPPRQSQLYQIRQRNRSSGIVAQYLWEQLLHANHAKQTTSPSKP